MRCVTLNVRVQITLYKPNSTMAVSELTPLQKASHLASNPLNDPVKVLKQVAATRIDGCLQVSSNDVTWQICFRDGKLQYASSSFQSLLTLDYHFRCVGFNDFLSVGRSLPQSGLAIRPDEWLKPDAANSVFAWFVNNQYLNILQVSQLLENLTKEAIETFIWLVEGHYQWIKGGINPNKSLSFEMNLDLEEILTVFQNRIRIWQKFNPLIKSPHQRPYLFSQVSEESSPSALVKLSRLLKGMSIRQLALVLNQDELKIAELLYPFIHQGDVCLRNPAKSYLNLPIIPQLSQETNKSASVTKTFKVACIDDSPTILDEMNRFLDHSEYHVTKIDDPVKAASMLFRLKPDLILMDITMPEISGYKLCGLLRNSVALREVPIIMVTGRSGLIDKARARAAGATDYLVKPFTRGSLLAMVEKHLH